MELQKYFTGRSSFLTRKNREYSKTNIYHVIIKGIDSQDIFYDDRDKQVFLEKFIWL